MRRAGAGVALVTVRATTRKGGGGTFRSLPWLTRNRNLVGTWVPASTKSAHKSSPVTEAQRTILDLLDPADAAMAMQVFARNSTALAAASPPTTSAGSSGAATPVMVALEHDSDRGGVSGSSVQASNVLLVELAKSNTTNHLNKAFGYLSRMRSAFGRGVPSLAARNELIRACGRALARLRKDAEAGGSALCGAAAQRYVELAEGLWHELLDAPPAGAAIAATANKDAGGSSYQQQQAHGLSMALSSMIYVYCQCPPQQQPVMTARALRVYHQMLEKGVKPDRWAAAGLVKAVATAGGAADGAAGGAREAMDLLTSMGKDQHGIDVYPHIGLYYAIISSAIDGGLSAATGKRPPPRAGQEVMKGVVYKALAHMREQGLPVARRIWQKVLAGEAKLGRWEQVERHLSSMRAQGLEVTSAEQCSLLLAMGVAGEVRRVEQVVQREGWMGGARGGGRRPVGGTMMMMMTGQLYVSLIRAYCCCGDEERVRRAREEVGRDMVRQQRLTLHEATDVMKAMADAGMHDQAWEVFQEFQSSGRQPDVVMYSVAMRTASALGGVGRMEETYQAFVAEGFKPDLLMLNSLMAGYADAGKVDEAYDVLRRIRDTPGIKAGMDTYNVMIHALGKQGRTQEALDVAEEARREGLVFDAFTRNSLAQSCGGVLLSMADDDEGRGEVWGVPGDEGVVREEEGGEALVIDVHGLTVAETQAVLWRKLTEMMREQTEEEEQQGQRQHMDSPSSSTHPPSPDGGGGEEEEEVRSDDGGVLRDLIVITGYRARPRQGGGTRLMPGEALLKVAVREFLQARDLYYFHPHNNGGRFVIPRGSLRAYLDRQRKKEAEVKFVRLTLLRYIPLGSLLVVLMVVPSLQVHFLALTTGGG